MKHIREITHQGLLWVNVTKQTEKELDEIQKRFGFLDADIKESLPPFQRPKIVKRPGYYFMVLHFPVFDRESRRLGFTEVDFFLTATTLVTIHDGKLVTLENFFSDCSKNELDKQRYFTGTAVHVMFQLLSRLLESIFPIQLHINEDIGAVDRKLFGNLPGRVLVGEILRLKTNIVTFRRTMQAHKTVLDRLIMYSGRELDMGSYQTYLNDLREFSSEIWHMLESQMESINALHEASESIFSLRTNEVMKALTVISVTTFPLTLLATIFAIRAGGTPFIDHSYGFWLLLGLTIFGAATMVITFKKRGWL